MWASLFGLNETMKLDVPLLLVGAGDRIEQVAVHRSRRMDRFRVGRGRARNPDNGEVGSARFFITSREISMAECSLASHLFALKTHFDRHEQ